MSDPSTLARPYARAAFEVAREADALGAWRDALALAAAIASDDRVARLVGDPGVADGELVALFSPPGEAPAGFGNFLALLAENDRLALLPALAERFEDLKNEAEQTLAVRVRSPEALDEGQRQRLEKALAVRYGKHVHMDVEVVEGMIGGATIVAGDQVIDGSVSGKLERLAAAMRGR